MAVATRLLEFLDEQYETLRKKNQILCNDPTRDRVAVIVEPRRSLLLLKVIRNVMFFAGRKWNLHIFTSPENVGWIQEEFPDCFLRITPLDKKNLTREEYSMLLMSRAFWETIPEENVLIFQSDAMLFRRGIDAWIDGEEGGYDYVGANYYNPAHIAPELQGIQGGLSLRKKSAMIDCIEKVRPNHIHRYRRKRGYPPMTEAVIAEDVFFTHACEMLKKKVPSVEKRREFSIEADFHPQAMGHHGLTHGYLTEEQQLELLSAAKVV